jgi:predicted Zn finger-like uncharacterized protein
MFTVCPRCALPLAVTVADLRAGQGYVRCGRCANVFNALLALAEESGPAGAARAGESPSAAVEDMETASATTSRPALSDADVPGGQQEAGLDWVELAMEPPLPPASPPAPSPPLEDAAPKAEHPGAAEAPAPWSPPALRLIDSPQRPAPSVDLDATGEFTGTSTFETIILEGDTFLQTEETIPEEVMASELADVSRRIAAASGGPRGTDGAPADPGDDEPDVIELRAGEPSDAFGLYDDEDEDDDEDETADSAELAALREATGEFRHEANLGVPPGEAAGAFPKPVLRPGWKATTVAALLALLLGGQAVNHWRDDLATRPGWYQPMHGLAAMLGEPLQPNWDLNAYDVRQLGAVPEGADNHELRVRLRLANVGPRAQALPLLRLTLLDRYGKAVSRGELQPSQYLPRELHGLEFIARDQRIDTEVRVRDPTQQASSFELDVCVMASAGLRCAGDTPTVASRS